MFKSLNLDKLTIKFVCILYLLAFHESVHAKTMFLAIDNGFAAVVSESDYNNGAASSKPGLFLGFGFTKLSFEIGYRKSIFTQSYTNEFGNFDVTINDEHYLVGIRYDHSKNFSSKYGVAKHILKASYDNDQGLLFSSPLDGESTGFYFGIGLKWNMFKKVYLYGEGTYQKASKELTYLSSEVGIRIHFF